MTDAVRVLFVDADWLAVSKPSGVPTTAPPSAGVESLVDGVRSGPGRGRAHVHPLSRLDVEVTGVVLFALSDRALSAAERTKSLGAYRREYHALLAQSPSPPSGEWAWPIGIDPADRRLRTTEHAIAPVAARTIYRTVDTAAGSPVAHAAFELHTGRTHQIRVHAARASCPIVGDRAYGGPRHVTLGDGTVITARRVMLHAYRVAIPEANRDVICEYADDFASFWRDVGGGSL